MTAIFQTEINMDGLPEPNFCSVCQGWEEIIVYFLRGNIEVSMCDKCVDRIALFVKELRERLGDDV
jgi:hypothetical protein